MRNTIRMIQIGLLAALVANAANAVTVPQWNNMPVACTPARMEEWQEGVPETAQAPCHCPPRAMCPTGVANAAEFLNNNSLPPNVTNKCCQPPKCPTGTLLAGKPVPADGDCDTAPACPGGFVPVDYNGPYLDTVWGNVAGNVNVSKVCAPPCDGDYTVSLNFWGSPGGLSTVWEGEGVPNSTFTEGGKEFVIACSQVVATNDCLHGSSKVALKDGEKVAIETLKVGDYIKGPDGDVRVEAVNQLTDRTNYYTINDFDFKITGDHPLKTTKGWKSPSSSGTNPDVVGTLLVGDTLVTEKGEVKVTSINPVRAKAAEHAVNIRVAGDQPFYVDGVIVKPFKDIKFNY